VNRVIEIVENALGGILFIDEAYALRGMHSVITKLVQAMTDYDGKFGLIIAGYEKEIDALLKENEGWARRFKSNRFNIKPYTGSELAEIFARTSKRKMFGLERKLEAALPGLFENWITESANDAGWGNAGEAENLLEMMILNFQADNCDNVNPPKILSLSHLPEERRALLN
jgi:hypothetical protein